MPLAFDPDLLLELAAVSLVGDGDEDEQGRKWVEVACSGDYVKTMGGEERAFSLNRRVFEEIVANFNRKPNKVTRWDYEHASEPGRAPESFALSGVPAQGWAVELKTGKKPDGTDALFALTEWLEPAKTQVKEKKYRFCSPAIYLNPKDNQGRRNGAVLSSIALTNDPFLDRLGPIAATRGEPTTKGMTTMSPEEIAALKLELSNLKLEVTNLKGHLAEKGLELKASDAKAVAAEKALKDKEGEIDKVLATTRDARVAEAFQTYGEAQKLVESDKEQLGLYLTANPAGFEKRYPRLSLEKSALLRRQAGAANAGNSGDANIELTAAGGDDANEDDRLLTLSVAEHISAVQKRDKVSRNVAFDRVYRVREAAERARQ